MHSGSFLTTLCLICLLAATPGYGQTTAPAAQATVESTQAGHPQPATASSAPPPDDLRARTGNFEPTRFNLSPRGGLGLISAVSPYTLARWEVATGGSVMNFDRNPGDVDFFEYGLQVAVGLPGRVEGWIAQSKELSAE
jgi:hypothetical protein